MCWIEIWGKSRKNCKTNSCSPPPLCSILKSTPPWPWQLFNDLCHKNSKYTWIIQGSNFYRMKNSTQVIERLSWSGSGGLQDRTDGTRRTGIIFLVFSWFPQISILVVALDSRADFSNFFKSQPPPKNPGSIPGCQMMPFLASVSEVQGCCSSWEDTPSHLQQPNS